MDVTGMEILAVPLKLVAVPVTPPETLMVRAVASLVAEDAFPVIDPVTERFPVIETFLVASEPVNVPPDNSSLFSTSVQVTGNDIIKYLFYQLTKMKEFLHFS